MTDEKPAYLTFPCDFPLKIIGEESIEFVAEITETIKKHYPDTEEHRISHKLSAKGNFISITAVVHCHNKETLDALYIELTKHPKIKMVL